MRELSQDNHKSVPKPFQNYLCTDLLRMLNGKNYKGIKCSYVTIMRSVPYSVP